MFLTFNKIQQPFMGSSQFLKILYFIAGEVIDLKLEES